MTGLDIALVVAARGDGSALDGLLRTARGLFAQMIVVEDGVSCLTGAARPDLTLRLPWRGGAGRARNLGLALVDCDYVLFFDADDRFGPDLPALLDDLAGRRFDICAFRHADARLARRGFWAEDVGARAIWAEAGLAIGALTPVAARLRPQLACLPAYPWTRIYRTAFLREKRIGFAPTWVHNDIPPHWLGLLHAQEVLASDRIGALRQRGQDRLSDRRGAIRADLFAALDPVARVIARAAAPWQARFAPWAADLIHWAEEERAASGPIWQAEKRRFVERHPDIATRLVA